MEIPNDGDMQKFSIFNFAIFNQFTIFQFSNPTTRFAFENFNIENSPKIENS